MQIKEQSIFLILALFILFKFKQKCTVSYHLIVS